ncbi:uncharacterized protein LOC117288937, partial [Asterias rubens]|uniref:uncharacterized protein LOC117288937 n=1 Tax=Asterias rubens TaxID=7604 RepID=UPI0014551DE1
YDTRPCANINCQNGGACLVLGTSFTCQCTTGFTGQFCQTATDTVPPTLLNCPSGTLFGAVPFLSSTVDVTWTVPTAVDNSGVTPDITVSPRGPGPFTVGTTTIEYTATDGSGNVATCNFIVQVQQLPDTEAPVLVGCPTQITREIPVGASAIEITWTTPTVTDNSLANIVPQVSPRGQGSFNAGTTFITYTATDAAGNEGSCSFPVIVTQTVDSVAPVLTGCPQTTVTAELPVGQVQTFVSWSVPTATDNIDQNPIVSSTESPGPFGLGSFAVTYTARDFSGNEATCTFIVQVTPQADTVPPTLLNCPTGTLFGAVPFLSSSVDVTWTAPTAVDNSGVTPDITVSPRGPGPFGVGTTTIEYTATDGSGNVATCNFIVQVQQLPDTEAPVLVGCPTQITREIPVGASAIEITWTTPTVTDNSLANIVPQVSPRGQGSFSAGTTFITYTATDAAGNEGSCSFPVIVTQTVDSVAPVLTGCPPSIVTAELPVGQVQVFVNWNVPTATDNIDQNPTVSSTESPGPFGLGSFAVTYTARDFSGNEATCTFVVQVIPQADTVPPTLLNCPTGTLFGAVPFLSSTVDVTWTAPTAFDNSGVMPDITVSPRGPGAFTVGTTTIEYTATDGSGNTATCNFIVQVQQLPDTEAPVLVGCPTQITREIPVGASAISITWDTPTVTDNSLANIVPQVSPRGQGSFSAGNTFITYTATDAAGNEGSCSFPVIVTQTVDSVAPVLTNCPPSIVTAELPVGQVQVFVNWNVPTATDNIDQNPTVSSTESPGPFGLGSFAVTYTARDFSGNEATCTFIVQVIPQADTVPPTLLNCPTGTLFGAVPFLSSTVDVTWTAPTAFDNSGVMPDITVSPRGPGAFTVGTTTIEYTATDGSGNMATCNFIVQVQQLPDTEAPVLVGCPTQITREIPVGASAISITWDTPTVTDNSLANIVPQVSPRGQGSFSAGNTFITYTATDAAGNEGSCSFPVIVTQTVDSVAPVLTGCPQTIVTAELPVGQVQVFVNWNVPTATDNIDQNPTVSSTESPGPFGLGSFAVTYTARDFSGNEATCTFVVQVIPQADTVPPTLLNCPTGTLFGAVPFLSSTVDVTWTAPTAFDNSGVMPDITVSPRGPGAFTVGTTTIEYTATDGSGNMATCNFIVQVQQLPDTEAPVLVDCPSDITREIPVGSTAVSVSWTAPTATDNSLANIVPQVSPRGPGAFNAGNTVITYTATDAAGNEATCSFRVIVSVGVDDIPPVLTSCPNTIIRTVELNSAETVNVDWTLPTASDNSNGQVSVNKMSGPERGSPLGAGVHDVVYRLSDANNNFVECRFCIVVNTVDSVAPMITCPAAIQQTYEIGKYDGRIINWAEPTVSDASGGPITVTLLTARPSGSFFPAGTHTVQYSATDQSGRSASCDFTVTINPVDSTGPMFIRCPSDIVHTVFELPAQGAVVNWPAPLFFDASGIASITSRTPPDGTLFTSTATQVSYTVTDGAGLSDVCSFFVTVTVSNPCTNNPCGMGGNCVPTGPNNNDFMCVCAPCFTGPTCQISTNPCINNNCASGSVCLPVSGSCVAYTCQCNACSYGRFCDQQVDACDNHKCANGAMCMAQGCLQYSCSCTGCFQGAYCSEVYNPCDGSPCGNGGFCNSLANSCTGYTCQCVGCFTGYNCQTAIPNPCDQNPCQNSGTCRQTSGLCYAYECDCTNGFSGPRCQGITIHNNPCNSFPCANGAACLNMDGGQDYTCKCLTGYTGVQCTVAITATGAVSACSANPNPCIAGTCSNSFDSTSNNVNYESQYLCVCSNGFTGSNCGTQSASAPGMNVCGMLVRPCANGGVCSNVYNSYTQSVEYYCTCNAGFIGQHCETEVVNPCLESPCLNGGQCTQNQLQYTCSCAPGYTGALCENTAGDTTAPLVISCPSNFIRDAGSQQSLVLNWPPPQVVGGTLEYQSHQPDDTFNVGTNTPVSYIYADDAGNVAKCTFNVLVFGNMVGDSNSPIITCPPTANNFIYGNEQSVRVTFPFPTVFDNQGNALVTSDRESGSLFTEGTVQVTFTAIDISGNTATCQMDVVVTRVPAFTMQCPDPVTLELAQGTTCYTYTLPNPSYTNQAGNPTLGYFVTNAGATGQQFFTNVPFSGIIAYKAVDGSGQTADCNFQLTLTTMASPCSGIVCQNGGNCQVVGTNFNCQCTNDYSGQFCQTPNAGPCSGIVCQNGGICQVPTGSTFTSCQCPATHTGTFCETLVTGFNIACTDITAPPGNPGSMVTVDLPTPTYTGTTTPPQFYFVTSLGIVIPDATAHVVTVPNTLPATETITVHGISGGGMQEVCMIDITFLTAGACSNSPCLNGGQCTNVGTSYTCACTTGFTGNNCQLVVGDPCTNINCLNGGACQVVGNTFNCQCVNGYSGQFCANPPTGAFQLTCSPAAAAGPPGSTQQVNLPQPTYTGSNVAPTIYFLHQGSTIIQDPTAYDVLVPAAGSSPSVVDVTVYGIVPNTNIQDNCITQITVTAVTGNTPCSSNPCVNGGNCQFNENAYFCSCPTGYTGTNCQLDPCNSVTCLNGGACQVSGSTGFCQCINGYSGANCQNPPTDPCTNINCLNGGACQVVGNTFNCQCVNGYTGQFCASPPTGVFQLTCSPAAAAGPPGSTQQVNLPQPTYTGSNVAPTIYFLHQGSTIIQDPTAYDVLVPAAGSSPSVVDVTVYGIVPNTNIQDNCITQITVTAVTDTNPCSSNPCVNGGNCQVSGNVYFCSCPTGYTGTNCQFDPCNSVNCLNGGACQVSGSNGFCQCINGYSGANCQNPPTGSFQISCSPVAVEGAPNTPTSVNLPEPTFSGTTNTPNFIYTDQSGNTIPNPRAFMVNSPQNGVIMVNVGVTGIFGSQQDSCTIVVTVTVINPCFPNPCPFGQECFFFENTFLCMATGRRRRSVDRLELPGGVSLCDSHPCAHNGTCLSVMSPTLGEAMRCQCAPGWTGPTCLNEMYEVERPGEHSPEVWDKEEMGMHWMMVAVIGILALIIMTMSVSFLCFASSRMRFKRRDDVKLIH